MRVSTRAIVIGVVGGWLYTKALAFLLGYTMAIAWPDWWVEMASIYPRSALYLVDLTQALIALVVLSLPFAVFLKLLVPEKALLSAAAG